MTISQGSGTKPSGGTVTGERPLPVATPGPRTAAGAPTAPATDRRSGPAYDYERFSRLAGPLTDPVPGPDGVHRVRYRGLPGRRLRSFVLPVAAPLLSLALLVWVMRPEHWVHRDHVPWWQTAADLVMLASVGLIETFRVVNVASNAHAALVARNPVPVRPVTGTRVAFLTTCVPGKEPLEMVRATLAGALRVRHDGPLDVWLLDEGDLPEMRDLCARLGVRHFSRKGVARWNRPLGAFRARTKHGNYNSWLDRHGEAYDVMAFVDTDHVPLPQFLERMLGYFRDPDVAFVVGPQVYGNCETLVTRAAESQQFLFHALVQRAGNAYRAPMFVGTNTCVRIRALRQVGGLYDSITEDMATGLELHRTRNPVTGRRWRSVYTPDVLAVGEGPSSWTDFFNQQLRWSRGTYETLLRQFWRAPFSLSPGRLLNYSLLVTFYPMSALNWLLGAVSCGLFLVLGASGIHLESQTWLMFYGDAAALQIGLYLANRRHNVSPHEPTGSSGAAGMIMSALSAPLYVRSLVAALLRRRATFVVTPKGDSASPDRAATFSTHLGWAALLTGALLASFFLGHPHTAMRTWTAMALLIAVTPPLVWLCTDRRPRRRPPGGTPRLPATRSRAKEPTCELPSQSTDA